MKFLEWLNAFLNKVLLVLGGIAVLALMTLATANVVLRIFYAPIRGTYEIVSFLGALVIAFALGYTQKRKDNIIVDILTERFPERLARLVDTFAYLVMTIFFSIVTWQVFVWGAKIWRTGELSETLKVIYHPFILAVGFGFGVLALTTLTDFLNKILNRKEG
ncbi:MAG: transporter small rane protein component [Deltaproteobacteria bacterium]|jgi:TRAP-type C4-dicarboxylate transport system permease small subunit|nr:transporter small rane protein component [Deltaproteobacteria bacterium]